ncbi:YkgJ family cysteine cluster protein [Peribacillus frigoritolerans]|uniref:YkgJ family cysteine cluster protein n=1 Tax=Peribacillus castrilensis TaxID=2897690 RepID=UPI003DA5D482
MSKTISRNDPCFCGSGEKYKKCHSDVHPESRASYLINLNATIDKKVKDFQESTGNIPPCHTGCSNCCYDDFSISELEFEFIMREMKSWNNEDVERVYDIALSQCEEVKKDRPNTWRNLETYVEGKDKGVIRKQVESHFENYRNEFPCPLLDENTNSCKVYASRPIICRTYGTTHFKNNKYSSVKVCEHIPDSIEHAKKTPTADNEQFSATTFTNLTTPSGEMVIQRSYPIYYWFHIFYNRTKKKTAQYNHYDNPLNFNQTIEQANYSTLKGFNLI